jgi:hypothetical protein
MVTILFPHLFTTIGIMDVDAAAIADKIVGVLSGALALYGRISAIGGLHFLKDATKQ